MQGLVHMDQHNMSAESNEVTPAMFGVERCLSSELDRAEARYKVMVAEARESCGSMDNGIAWLSHRLGEEIEQTNAAITNY